MFMSDITEVEQTTCENFRLFLIASQGCGIPMPDLPTQDFLPEDKQIFL